MSSPPSGTVGFTRLGPEHTGVHFTNRLSDDLSITNTIVNNGSGLACGDVDGDGLTDLFFCGLQSPNSLYRNLGQWRFADITDSAGLRINAPLSTGAVFADTDGDGDLDLLVSGIGSGARLFENDGRGHFTERTDAGLLPRYGATSMALADADGDGDLDLYVANYRTSTIMDLPGVRFAVSKVNNQWVVTKVDGIPTQSPEWEGRFYIGPTGALREAGEPDAYYLNDGRGRFTAIPWTTGTFRDESDQVLTDAPRDWGLSVLFRDLNGDGAPDLYICNDADSPDRFWVNDGSGHFTALPGLALRHTSLSSMGADAADLNRDGRDDLFVLDMLARRHEKRHTQLEKSRPPYLDPGDLASRPQYSRNTLQIQRADGTYAEIACAAGLIAADWAWCPIFLDVDLDGFEDLLVANGFHREVEDIDTANRIRALKAGRRVSPREELRMRALFPRWDTPNLAFRNRGDLTFEEIGGEWGFDTVGVSQGMALADLDNDGDLDVVVNNLNAAAGLYRNESSAPRVAVRLQGMPPNTRGIGARLRFLGGPVPIQTQELQAGGRYLSSDDALRVFAAGTGPMTLEVHWRSGRVSVVPNVPANSLCIVREADAPAPTPISSQRHNSTLRAPWFEDVSHRLAHRHTEPGFDDSHRQPLNPRRLGQMGPGIAWFDLDGDGRDDLLIGAARGFTPSLRLNAGSDGFRAVELPGWPMLAADAAGLLGWSIEPGHSQILVAQDHYNSDSAEPPSVLQHDFFFGSLETRPLAPAAPSSIGPLALTDFDGDGDLDLFIGGRVVPGRYPVAASSRLFTWSGNRWMPEAAADRLLTDVGLVRGAVWTDLEADGFPELVLACEWGPIRIFRNRRGQLAPWNPVVSWPADPEVRHLDDLAGWWTGLASGDLDGDGLLDLVVGNWGRNSRYASSVGHSIRVRHGDVDQNGTWDVLETYADPFLNKEVPWCDWTTLRAAIPGLANRFSNYRDYGVASVQDILGDALQHTAELRVRTFDSILLLNRGDRFQASPLPAEAQWSPVFGICIADANGDGFEDVYLAQNFFAADSETGRCDAGRGLWLQGDGNGALTPVDGSITGIRAYGEQRGAALADFDADGRVDLAVTQNGGDTQLYRNLQAHPGLRVRLRGPPGNPPGFGAVIRAGANGRWGPAREIRGGSGHWSQDSPVTVLSPPPGAPRLQVRWPGGRVTEIEAPIGSRDVEVTGPTSSPQ